MYQIYQFILDFTIPGECVDPGYVPNAQRDRGTGQFPTGTVVTYTCIRGYQGTGSITCQPNGLWSSGKPTCAGMESYPEIGNAKCTERFNVFAQKMRVRCEISIFSLKVYPFRGNGLLKL